MTHYLFFVFFFPFIPFVVAVILVDPVLIPQQLHILRFVLIIGTICSYKIHKKKLVAKFSFYQPLFTIGYSACYSDSYFSFFQTTVLSESIYVFVKLLIEILFFITYHFFAAARPTNIIGWFDQCGALPGDHLNCNCSII